MGNAPLLQTVGFQYIAAGAQAFKTGAAQLIAAVQGLNQAQTQGARTASTFTQSLSRGLLSVAGGAGIALGVAGVTREILQLGKESVGLAIKADTIGTAYEAATRRAGFAADDLLKKLDAAARGTVTTANLEASANKALALGVGQNAEQIGDLLAIARQKGKDFGIDTNEAFDNITTGLGRLSPRILDNLGIILDENKIYKEYATSINAVGRGLSDQEKRQALVNALIRDNTDLITKNADARLSAADKIARAEAQIEALKTKTAAGALPTIGQFAGAAGAIVSGEISAGGIRAREQALAASTTTLAEYTRARDKANFADLTSGDAARQFIGILAMQQGALDNNTVALIQQAGAHERNAAAATANFAALDQLNRGLIAVAPPPPPITDDERKVRHEQLTAAIIAGGTQIITAQRTRDDALLAADTAYTIASGRLFADLNQAIADGATQRAALVAQGAKAVGDLIAGEASRATRQAEDRASTDARTARGRREEDAASAASYGQQRAALIASQHAAGVKAEEAYQRDLTRATRQGQQDQYSATASYLERLFALTRGRRNKAALEEGQRVLKAAQAEAAELAKTDPAAAAALIAARQSQYIAGLEQKNRDAQLRKDAKRHGGLTPAEAEAEIAAEHAAIDASNKAVIDGINQTAKDKADDRKREKEETATANKTAVDDLDAAERDRRDKLATARKEQDGDLAADRASEDRRRAEDYAKQLGDLRTANAEALVQFDINQAAKIEKIKDAIKDEKAKYDAQHAQILADYDTLSVEIQAKIDEAKRLIDVTPAAEDIMRQKTALQALGREYGQAFLDAYIAAINKNLPVGVAPVAPIQIGAGPAGPIGTGSATGAGPGIHSQSLNGLSIWHAAPPRTTGPVTSTRAITVDLRGATFGAGVNETQIRNWIRPELDRSLKAFEDHLLRETGDLATRGALT